MHIPEALSTLPVELCRPFYKRECSNPPTLEITPVNPVTFEQRGDIYFVDFGKAAWGNLQVTFDSVPLSNIIIRLGEKLKEDGTIDRTPPGSVVFREVVLTPKAGQKSYLLDLPHQQMHDDPMALESNVGLGEITVFRYVEIQGAQEPLKPEQLRQLFVHAPFDDDAASFQCSDKTLTAVWDLCKHTIKATTAFGIYIDGERERIPYEADSYTNQLSHFACDLNPAVARASFHHLLENPTWPTEWNFHTIMMAAADYEATGESAFVEQYYEELKGKLLMDKAGEDGLLRAGAIVDWPPGECDGYNQGEMLQGDPEVHPHTQFGPEINTVVNAFYFHALERMAFLAGALGEEGDCAKFQSMSRKVFNSFNAQFFDVQRQIYIDGVSPDGKRSNHASLHANMFALAFGLAPREKQSSIASFVESRGMACSVYGAQYLLEALFRAGRDEAALRLLTARSERSWWHMIELGSTMTLEAWDVKYKSNLTWNHAWGAAPVNIVARYILGVRALSPGYADTLIAPQPGTLEWADGRVPTPYGAVEVIFRNEENFYLEITVPFGMTVQVKWPRSEDSYVEVNGVSTSICAEDNMIAGEGLMQGHYILKAVL